MDIRKLLLNINLIIDIEKIHDIQSVLHDIQSYYQSNSAEEVNARKETIHKIIKESEINNFVYSDINILSGINSVGYFDVTMIDKLEEILNSPIYEAGNELSDFINRREELLADMVSLQGTLMSLGVVEDKSDVYQIVLSLAEQYQDLDKLKDFLGDTNNILQRLNSKQEDAKPIKISSVNNGSIELFIEVVPELANWFSIITESVVEICIAIGAYESLITRFEKYSQKRKKTMEENAKAQLEEDKKRILDDLIKKLPTDEAEDKSGIGILLTNWLPYLENGVRIEVKTPNNIVIEIDGDVNNEEISISDTKTAIDNRNRQLFLIQQKGLRLELPKPDEEKEDD